MIYTDVGCCCSLFDVVSSVVFSFCQQVSKQIVCFFFFFVCFFFSFFFFLPLSLYPPFSFFLSLSSPSLLTFPTTFFFFFFFFFIYLFIYLFIYFSFLLSLSCFLCPLVLSVTVWLSKRVYKIKLIN